MADSKIDPFDVEALEKSLNDSATRVSTIWVSFLIFSLYLLTAAATVTHKQLFLAEPVKLPVLNIDLPLWGFFFLAPILFVILHAYVLIQVILLARTAAAYNEAVRRVAERDGLSAEANASLRQRLANTLFAQILAGSPREREGGFGRILNFMAWITLAIAPILILLTFQFAFLPYHSHIATWTHRLLILLEFALAFRFWPLVLNPSRDFHWPDWRGWAKTTAALLGGLLKSRDAWRAAWQGLRQQPVPLAAGVAFIALSLSIASFPGEPHVNVLTAQSIDSVQCDRWIQRKFDIADLRFDRLALARVDVIDYEKLEKIVQATTKAGERPYEGERTRILRDRDFNCGDFSIFADLRRVDLSGSRLRHAYFTSAKLGGASLDRSQLQGAFLYGAQLQGAFLAGAELQGASLSSAEFQGASLYGAQLQGASLDDAQLQGVSLAEAQLQGASLDRAQLQGAILAEAQLQGASLDRAQLQGAFLGLAELQGASLSLTGLQGASLSGAQLQGSFLDKVGTDTTVLSEAWVWRARATNCDKARLSNSHLEATISVQRSFDGRTVVIGASPEEIERFLAVSVAGIPNGDAKEAASKRMREGLVAPANDDSASLADVWHRCETESRKVSPQEFDDRHVTVLRGTVCDAERDGAAIGRGIARNWISVDDDRREFSAKLARALLGEDGKTCAAAADYDGATKKQLRAAAGPPPTPPAPK